MGRTWKLLCVSYCCGTKQDGVQDNLDDVRDTYWVQIEYVNLYFKISQDERCWTC
jgi:hypothetical protein